MVMGCVVVDDNSDGLEMYKKLFSYGSTVLHKLPRDGFHLKNNWCLQLGLHRCCSDVSTRC